LRLKAKGLSLGEIGPQLAAQVATWLAEWWPPQQISARLRIEFPGDPMMHVSHETICQAL
jgi:IS30 family transposase